MQIAFAPGESHPEQFALHTRVPAGASESTGQDSQRRNQEARRLKGGPAQRSDISTDPVWSPSGRAKPELQREAGLGAAEPGVDVTRYVCHGFLSCYCFVSLVRAPADHGEWQTVPAPHRRGRFHKQV
ncbi:hypothetical protein NDU88_010213 [Pleurodeles waltl]|uniref:Uncharacterized protein n=1 Tax=Pleurodeles waltl TaxID=8319 RepID=A0AAV7PXL8_PLEWA|nr:hypothetical protein NDU88_010213 [Pleurodeles waltl]